MNIKKALLFMESHAEYGYKYSVKKITAELSEHLNRLADAFEEKDIQISQLQTEIESLRGERDRYKEALLECKMEVNNLRQKVRVS